ARGFQADFPVVDDRRLVGLITRDALVSALHQSGPSALVSDSRVKDFSTAVEATPLTEVLQKMQDTGIKAVPILKGGELKGLITLEQIGKFNMLCSGYSCEFMQAGK
ncbi:MAG: CBS domain-containing protein, partial [Desulfomonile tiedjei]|nr:CBS domain-containing protein [Desulfomonile tiedjei]